MGIILLILVLSGCYVGCDLKKLRLVNSNSKMNEKIVMIKALYGNYTNSTLKTKSTTDETAQIVKLGNEIKQIKQETEYIKEYGNLPPQTPDFYKKLNII